MSHDKIIRMANQIATFFKSQPEQERLSGIADHINQFWEPRMRKDLFALLEAGEGAGLDPLVVAAAEQYIKRPHAA
jgi:formate dehydrogenase subunit delta